MKSNSRFALAAGIVIAAAVGGCASTGAPSEREATAVRQAANGAIVGCATNPATRDDVRFSQPHPGPFCSRKG